MTGASSSLSLNSSLLSVTQESINDLTRDGDFRVTGTFHVSLLGICAHHPNCPPHSCEGEGKMGWILSPQETDGVLAAVWVETTCVYRMLERDKVSDRGSRPQLDSVWSGRANAL